MATPRATPEDLNEQLAQLREDLKALTNTVAGLAKAQAENLRKEAERTVHSVTERGEAYARMVGEKAGEAVSVAEDAVARNPATSLGVAALVGFILGFMTRGRG